MAISNSLDFERVAQELSRNITMPTINWHNRRDLLKMLDNIEDEVHELSRLEVEIRRNPSHGNKQKHGNQLEKINADIEQLEQFITFGLLL